MRIKPVDEMRRQKGRHITSGKSQPTTALQPAKGCFPVNDCLGKLRAVTVALRILTLLLSLFVAGPLGLSAHALVRPETRVGGSPHFSSVFASAASSQAAEPHQENPGCGYDFAPAVHKYLYCHDDPINRIDPSGHLDLVQLGTTFAIQGAIGAVSAGGINYALHRDGKRAAIAAAWGFGIGGVGGTAIAYLRSFYLARSLAAEAAGGAATGAGTGAVALAEGDTVIGIVLKGNVVPQSVMIAGAPHTAAATAAGVTTQTAGQLAEGAAAFTASKVGGEIVVLGSGTYGGTMKVAEETIAAVRAFFH